MTMLARITLVLVAVASVSGCSAIGSLQDGVATLRATKSCVERLEPTLSSIATSADKMTSRVDELATRVSLLSGVGPAVVQGLGEVKQPLEKVAALKAPISAVAALAAPLERVSRFERPLEQLATAGDRAPAYFLAGLALWMLGTTASVSIGIRLGLARERRASEPAETARPERAPIVTPSRRSARVLELRPSTRAHVA